MAEQTQKRNFAELIRTIYFYFFAGLGLVLLIIGIFNTSNWAVKKFFLPKYYLDYEETRCDYTKPIPVEGRTVPLTDQELQVQKDENQKCQSRLEEQRKFKEVTDIAKALTFIIVGAIVFIFHFKKTSLFHKNS